MVNNEVISIIVPVYKVEQYLSRCIESVLCQTYPNFELILVEDGSPDGCGAICDDYAKKDPRVKVIHKKNEGVSIARKTGVASATGTYLMFLDSDDWYEENMVEVLYATVKEQDCDIAACNYFNNIGDKQTTSATGDKAIVVYGPKEALRELHIRNKIFTFMWNKIYKATLFEGLNFAPGIIVGEDYQLNVQAIEKSSRIAYVDQAFYHYFFQTGSVCNAGYTEKHRRVLENFKAIADEVSLRYAEIAKDVRAFCILEELAMITAMCKNNNFDKEVIKIVKKDVKTHLLQYVRNGNVSIVHKVSAVCICISYRLFAVIYKLTN